MKISIVTVVYNNKEQVEQAIESVLSQGYSDLEYIIVDGGSTDGTLDIVKRYGGRISKWKSEPDKGIYDAMNKGIGLATGDVVGFLNSDDVYINGSVISKIAAAFRGGDYDACYGDITYVGTPTNDPEGKTLDRNWIAGEYKKGSFKKGWVPPHPAFFVKKAKLDAHGNFNTTFSISADFELMLRLIEGAGIKIKYLPEVIVKMRWGGNSTKNITNIIKGNLEKYKSFKANKLKATPLYFIYNFLFKIKQLKLSKQEQETK
ncbi:MAG: glycosyltransferase [bacterium]|nr:glycosyltransferase [bacterium]